jgi:HAD superfamily hydrolase (TIGR01509 family)
MTAALLFDLDGTLVDTDHLHLAAFNQVLAGHGVDLGREEYSRQVMGKSNLAIAAALLPDVPLAEAAHLLGEKERAYRAMVRDLAPLPGLLALLDWAAGLDLPCAVVTHAPRANADLVLDALGLRARFRALVIADELPEMKPHPLPYLTGLAELGARAERSVVFEDSPSGILAGSRAGMPVMGLKTSLDEAALLDAGATLAIQNYEDPRLRPFITARMQG